MANLGSLSYQIKADTSQLNQAEGAVRASTGKMSQSFFATFTAANLVSQGIAMVTSKAVAMAKQSIDTGMRLQQMSLSFKAIAGSHEAAGKEMEFVRGEAKRLGQDFLSMADAYKGISAAAKGTSLEGKGVRDIFVAISEAGTTLGLSSEQVNRSLYAMSQMISKGKVSSEELRQQLGESLPGAFQVAAKSMGMTTQAFDKLVSEGKVMTEDFAPKFAKAYHERSMGSVAESANSARAASNRLANAFTELQNTLWKQGESSYTSILNWTTQMVVGLGDIVKNATEAKNSLDKLKGMSQEEQNRSLLPQDDRGILLKYWDNVVEAQDDVQEETRKSAEEFNTAANKVADFLDELSGIPEFKKVVVDFVIRETRMPPSGEGWSGPGGTKLSFGTTEERLEAGRLSVVQGAGAGLQDYESNKLAQTKTTLATANQAQADAAKRGAEYEQKYRTEAVKTQELRRNIIADLHALGASQDIVNARVAEFDRITDEHNKKAAGTALTYQDFNQDLADMEGRSSSASKSLMDLQYTLAILQRERAGQKGEAEWFRIEKSSIDAVEESWKRVADAQNKYNEIMDKMTKERKGGVAPEATQAGRDALSALNEVYAKEEQIRNLAGTIMPLEQWGQWTDALSSTSSVELARIKKDYYELTGELDKQKLAQAEYTQAAIARFAEEHKDVPELVAWYKKLTEEQQKSTDKMSEFAVQAARNIQSELGDALYNAVTGKFDDIGTNFADLLAKMASQAAAAQIGNLLFGNFGQSKEVGGLAGDLIKWVGGLFSPSNSTAGFGSGTGAWMGHGHAGGGPVAPGRSYLVGERGPELFSPSGYGKIIANNDLGGGSSIPGGVQVNVINNTGVEAKKPKVTPRFDINYRKMILDVVLDAKTNDEGFRNRWGASR